MSKINSIKTIKLSIIIPCYEEAQNIEPLCTRLLSSLSKPTTKTKDGSQQEQSDFKFDTEVLLIDDFSSHKTRGTQQTQLSLNNFLKKNKSSSSFKVSLYSRLPDEGKGLSSAVLYGLLKARSDSDALMVMDADLQHEPESVPQLVKALMGSEGVDFVFGSRNVGGGEYGSFSLFRRVVSFGATVLALPLTSSSVSDPMSGFFCFKRTVLNRLNVSGNKISGKVGNKLNPLGYKIGLELLVKGECNRKGRVVEVPISFGERVAGESKLSAKQYILYLLHLVRLYWFVYPLVFVVLILSFFVAVYIFVDILVARM